MQRDDQACRTRRLVAGSKIDVSIVRSPMGVAGAASCKSTPSRSYRTILCGSTRSNSNCAEHHDAYQHPYFKTRPYCLLMTGPSGSGDIGSATVHPAQGVKTLTVVRSEVLVKCPGGSKLRNIFSEIPRLDGFGKSYVCWMKQGHRIQGWQTEDMTYSCSRHGPSARF
jgi:hypothetical protein